MRLLTIPTLLLVANLCVAQPTPQTFTPAKSPAEASFSTDRLKRLDNLMQGFIDEGKAPNMVTFVARNGGHA